MDVEARTAEGCETSEMRSMAEEYMLFDVLRGAVFEKGGYSDSIVEIEIRRMDGKVKVVFSWRVEERAGLVGDRDSRSNMYVEG